MFAVTINPSLVPARLGLMFCHTSLTVLISRRSNLLPLLVWFHALLTCSLCWSDFSVASCCKLLNGVKQKHILSELNWITKWLCPVKHNLYSEHFGPCDMPRCIFLNSLFMTLTYSYKDAIIDFFVIVRAPVDFMQPLNAFSILTFSSCIAWLCWCVKLFNVVYGVVWFCQIHWSPAWGICFIHRLNYKILNVVYIFFARPCLRLIPKLLVRLAPRQ